MNTPATPLRVVFSLFALMAVVGPGVVHGLAQQADSANAQRDKWDYTAIKKVPEKATKMQNPLEADPDSLAAGGKLFDQHCAECHGMKAEGGRRGPSLLRPEVRDATPGALFWILTNGVIWHGMPDWSKLPDPQRWQIVAFLKSFKGPAAP